MSEPETERSLEALVAMSSAFSPEGGLAQCLPAMLSAVCDVLGAQCAAAILRDGEEPCLAEHGLTDPSLREETLDALKVAVEGRSALVQHRSSGGWVAAAPIEIESSEGPVGGLALAESGGGSPAPTPRLLESLSRQLALHSALARRFGEISAAASRVHLANRVTSGITSSSDLVSAMPGFARELAAVACFDRLACALVNDSGDYIEVFGHPAGTTWGLGGVIPVVGSGPGWVVLNDRPLLATDLLHQHRFIEDMRLLEEGLRSYLLLPLNARGRTIGVMALGSTAVEAYDQSRIESLQPLAGHVALAFDNVRLLQRSRELSITDELTPLYNVRFFHQILDREIKLVDRYRSMLSVVFIDLDRFKPVNDQYGHLRGSRVLREVGFLLRSAVRETDYPARYGGDEFVVILPQADSAAATSLASKLRNLVESHVFLQEEGINVTVGLSFGVATYPTEARTKEALIRLADQRMYENKDVRRPR